MPQIKVIIQDGNLRKNSFDPYQNTLSEEDVRKEVDRCLHCGRCTECDNCFILCPDISILCKSEGNFGYDIDYDYCKGCGICATECPRNAMTMVSESESLPEALPEQFKKSEDLNTMTTKSDPLPEKFKESEVLDTISGKSENMNKTVYPSATCKEA